VDKPIALLAKPSKGGVQLSPSSENLRILGWCPELFILSLLERRMNCSLVGATCLGQFGGDVRF
jgi:hypothetical protein